jgi:hypothetical protein
MASSPVIACAQTMKNLSTPYVCQAINNRLLNGPLSCFTMRSLLISPFHVQRASRGERVCKQQSLFNDMI